MAAKIKKARGGVSTSQFCREALAEKLGAMKIPLTKEEVDPPDRAGKGGPKKRNAESRYPAARDREYHLNERPSSKPLSDEQDAARRAGEKLDQ